MSEKYKFNDPDGIYFVTMTIVFWIDLFTRRDFKNMVVESLTYCKEKKGLKIHAWCIMDSHMHLIISRSEQESLSDIMRDFKKYTSKRVIDLTSTINESRREWLIRAFENAAKKLKRNSKYKVWQDGNHPVLLDTNEMMDQRMNYIHQNPVESGIVEEAEHYLFSSARDYSGKKGLLEVEFIE